MAWRGRATALECKTIDEFEAYLRGLSGGWRPSGMVVHNTASPTLYQWWHSVPPAQRMENLKAYYIDQGWSAGPHAFVDGKSYWIMTDFNVQGVHSPSWNGTRLGIEMVGDYDTESDESGMGLNVMNMTVALFGVCHETYGWEPSNTSIKLHKEDPATTHDCPGKNVVKSEFVADVNEWMADGGDHNPEPEPPPAEPRIGVVHGLVAGDHLNIRASASSSAPIIGEADNDDELKIVAEAYNGSTKYYRVQIGEAAGAAVAVYGWASAGYIRVEGEAANPWHENIHATEFGGAGDVMQSAYGGMVNGKKPGVALPYKWKPADTRPTIIVKGPSGVEHEAPVVDLGPWNLDDPGYVNGTLRPMAETQYANEIPAQNGQIPSNNAGIDLTPPLATAVGFKGPDGTRSGKVAWRIKA